MRLLLVADLHYALPQFDWVLDVAGDFDLVVMAGDHLDIGSQVDGRAQSLVVKKYFTRLRNLTRLVICSGNHDLDSRNEAGEKVARWLAAAQNEGVLSDGDSFTVGDTLFTICPWWDGPLTRVGIGALLADAAAKRTGQWIWIHHAPPDKSPISWGGSRSYGDVELRRWIEEHAPDIVLSGHVHQSPFVREGSWVDRIGPTWVFNAGHQFGAPPAHVIMDTDAGEALWFSAAGNQYVRLDQPLERPVPALAGIPDWLRVSLKALDPRPALSPG
jgi:Icc-related predicted phosphoesterase